MPWDFCQSLRPWSPMISHRDPWVPRVRLRTSAVTKSGNASRAGGRVKPGRGRLAIPDLLSEKARGHLSMNAGGDCTRYRSRHCTSVQFDLPGSAVCWAVPCRLVEAAHFQGTGGMVLPGKPVPLRWQRRRLRPRSSRRGLTVGGCLGRGVLHSFRAHGDMAPCLLLPARPQRV